MTKEELRNHILQQLGIYGVGEDVSDDDASLVETVIDNCHAELEALEVASWSLDDVPGHVVESFCAFVKPSLTAFGQDYDPAAKQVALAQLRTVTQDRRSGTGRACYF